MAKFATIKRGVRARTLFNLPLLVSVQGPEGETAPSVPVALVALDGHDEAESLAAARAFAIAHGVENPKPGEPLYERGLWLHVVLRTVMDPDIPDKNEPFFSGAEEILKFLDPDRISLLFHAQRAWQAKIAPAPGKMNEVDYLRHIVELAYAAEEEDRTGEMFPVPFDALPLAMQLRFTRRVAAQFSTWSYHKSLSGSGTPAAPPTSPSSSPTPSASPPASPSASTESSAPTASPSETAPAPPAPPAPEVGT